MYKKSFLQPILLGLIVLISLVSCDKDYNEIGSDIVGDDHFDFPKYTDATVEAYNQKLGSIASNNLAVNPLGFYTNPAFGTTQANFVTQVELSVNDPRFNNVDPQNYQNPTVLDSVVLEIPYYSTVKEAHEVQVNGEKEIRTTYELDNIYGATPYDQTATTDGAKFKLSVYQSNYFLRNLDPGQSLAESQLYYTDQDMEIDNNKIPVLLNNAADVNENNQFYFDEREHKTFTLDVAGDTINKARSKPSMRLHLRNDVFNTAIINAPSGQLANNNVFKNYFRGIYFKTESLGNPGNMALMNFKEGKITLYYNEDVKKTVDGVVDYDRVNKTYVLNLNGNTVSLLKNTNENIDYLNAANSPNTESSKLYLKGGQGSIAMIDLFGPDSDGNGIADEIEAIKANGWLINEANLTFYVDKTAMAPAGSPLPVEPTRIFLYDLTNNKVLADYSYDQTTNSANPKYNKGIFGGILEKENVSDGSGRGVKYKIRITNHIRNLINKDSTNVRLGLSVTENINNAGFSKLEAANSNTDRAPSMSVMSPVGTVLYGTNIPFDSNPNSDYAKKLKLEIYYTKPD